MARSAQVHVTLSFGFDALAVLSTRFVLFLTLAALPSKFAFNAATTITLAMVFRFGAGTTRLDRAEAYMITRRKWRERPIVFHTVRFESTTRSTRFLGFFLQLDVRNNIVLINSLALHVDLPAWFVAEYSQLAGMEVRRDVENCFEVREICRIAPVHLFRKIFASISETFFATGNTFAAPDILVSERRSNGAEVYRSVDIWNIRVDPCARVHGTGSLNAVQIRTESLQQSVYATLQIIL